ncbi:tRNA(Ser) Um(44) 2'-O-methyltransferase [Penicillium capsulatum]|uniref:tRNA (uracil-O(2)-)-methyltransferase n=1 Tax=Penicillium capsulatum TaxID=69766 RepID=A0A9W9LVZ0_9EURO|nr:tRNA(Ser) Um(44) 2'-O-methyltransferase [Penicillium capsulatum]KAJ6122133.1 tRNA(Ser) Um(44) 2'-O-methyltransferase [Penicillium capsulatum]
MTGVPTLNASSHGGFRKNNGIILSLQAVQNTAARLEATYATDLCRDWPEQTPPSKDVFENLAIAAYLIELWRNMYGVNPVTEDSREVKPVLFPGFVDIACGTGVLVYVLLMEGYRGRGYDAQSRKSWDIFPKRVREQLMERVYVPKPFMDCVDVEILGMRTYTEDFSPNTFIISNHADELTVWTPLMAALACPASPLPFLAIPCCSHSLSGRRHRYPAPKDYNGDAKTEKMETRSDGLDGTSQPASGDLRALRAAKAKEKTADGIPHSRYGSLTEKTAEIAREVGYRVERTSLEIHNSTRNLGIMGNCQTITQTPVVGCPSVEQACEFEDRDLVQKICDIVERECSMDGGVEAAARIWIGHARNLQRGQIHDHSQDTCQHT